MAQAQSPVQASPCAASALNRGSPMVSGGSGVTAMFGGGCGCGASSAPGLSDDMGASGNVSFSIDGRPAAGDFRKEGKMVLPKLEAPGQAGSAQPSAAIRGFEVWALK
eukprot:4973504-Amphidinium_carterae.1